MTYLRLLITVAIALGIPSIASAQVAWTGDFETGDLSQFNFLLNPTINNVDYSTVVTDIVLEGTYAGRIELHDDARWPNDLRRVEFQHAPGAARTAEGETTYFAWSVYFPEDVAIDPSTQIAYWESGSSFRQMMAFTLRGRDLSFVTRQPNNVVHWDGTGVVTPAEWHRIAMRVLWSKDPAIGTVSVWFDGEEVVSDVPAKTLNDDNPHFVQIGMLRGDIDFADIPVIYIDDAVEGATLADVRPDGTPVVMEPGPGDVGPSDDVGAPPDAGPRLDMAVTGPDLGPGNTPTPDSGSSHDGSSGPVSDANSSGGEAPKDGCCSHARPIGSPNAAWLALLVAFFAVRFRKA